MEQIKELLKSRITQVHDPVQKILLQDVLVDVFGELLGYSEACFAHLEKKLDEEMQTPDDSYTIYTGVCKKDGVDDASRSLFEIQKDEKEEAHVQGYLGTVFLACDYPAVRHCIAESHRARIETDMGDYETTVRLGYCSAYLKKFEWLYQQFWTNQKPWHTINCPFAYKLLDVIDEQRCVPQEAIVARVEVDLGEFSEYVENDMVLVWNLSQEIYRPQIELAAAGNAAYYMHRIPLPDSAVGCLALTEGEEVFSTVVTKDSICIRTQTEKYKNIELAKIERMDMQKDHTALRFPLQTNRRRIRHADRQAYAQPRYLWTRGEVERILRSYEVFSEFELEELCIDRPGELDAIDMNPFVKVHSFLKKKRKLAVVLHAKDQTDIFRYEKMFFLLAELQLCTQEYEWTGIMR